MGNCSYIFKNSVLIYSQGYLGNSEFKLNTFLFGGTSWSLSNDRLQQATPTGASRIQHFPNLRDSCSGSFIGLVLGNVDVGVSFVNLFMLEQELFM